MPTAARAAKPDRTPQERSAYYLALAAEEDRKASGASYLDSVWHRLAAESYRSQAQSILLAAGRDY